MDWCKTPLPIHPWDQIQQKCSSGTGRSRESGLVMYCCESVRVTDGKICDPYSIFGKWIRLVAPNNEDTQTEKWIARHMVEVTDRTFPIGSWVTKDGNVGQVQNLQLRADLRIVGSKLVAIEVPFDRLHPVEKFPEGSYILYDGCWIGQVVRVLRNVTVKVGEDGEVDPYTGVIDSRECAELFVCPYNRKFKIFPMQKISGEWHSLRESTWEWIPKTKKQKVETEFVGRVHSVEVTSIDVTWKAYIKKDDLAFELPERNLKAEVFSRVQLSDFPDVNHYRVGEIRLFDPRMDDTYETYETWKNSNAPGRVSLSKIKEMLSPVLGKYISTECLRTKTMVEVLWKDGSRSIHPGVDLEPYEATNVDFIRGDMVLPRHQDPDSEIHFGSVDSASHNLKTVNVNWFGPDWTLRSRSTVAQQDLRIMEGFNCFAGNVVYRYGFPQEDPFLIGSIVEIGNNATALVKCFTTGQIRELIVMRLVPLHHDNRHSTEPLPALKLEQLTLMESSVVPALKDSRDRVSVSTTFMSWDEHYFRKEPVCIGEPKILLKELLKFNHGLKNGAHVISYERRLDLYSVILIGSQNTPFEDFVFLFDMFVPSTYPNHPPQLFYKSDTTIPFFCALRDTSFYIHEVLNKPWDPLDNESNSLFNLLNSLQESIFTKEPYYNLGLPEREKHFGCPKGQTNSRLLNEKLTIDLVDWTDILLSSLQIPNLSAWREALCSILSYRVPRVIDRIEGICFQNKPVAYPLKVVSPDFKDRMTRKLPTLKYKLWELSQTTQTDDSMESIEKEFECLDRESSQVDIMELG